MVRLEVVLKAKTDKAVLISYEDEEVWIPRSTLSVVTDREIDYLDRGAEFTIRVAQWIAKDVGLV